MDHFYLVHSWDIYKCLWSLGSAEKNGKLILLLNWKEQSRFIASWKLWLNLCSLRWIKPKLLKSYISRVSQTLNKLYGVDCLINFSNEFLKASCNTDLRISRHKLFHSLTMYGKQEFEKYSVLQDICRNLSTLQLWWGYW